MSDGHVGLTLDPDELTFVGVRLHQVCIVLLYALLMVKAEVV